MCKSTVKLATKSLLGGFIRFLEVFLRDLHHALHLSLLGDKNDLVLLTNGEFPIVQAEHSLRNLKLDPREGTRRNSFSAPAGNLPTLTPNLESNMPNLVDRDIKGRRSPPETRGPSLQF